MRITVVGGGAMGSFFAGVLACVADVWLLSSWREHVEAIRRQGLRIVEGSTEAVVSLPATTDVADVGLADLAIVLVKSHQTERAAAKASAILKPDGLALTLQNGLGNAEVLGRALGRERVWQGVTSHGATLLGPGRVRHAGAGPTYLALRPAIAAVAEEVAALFERALIETHLSEDLDGLIWGKLVVNAGLNALTAILRVPNGALLRNEHAGSVMDRAVAEAAAVAKAKGIVLPYDDPIAKAREVAAATATNRSSMLQDVLRESPTEIDFINGAIAREAARLGLSAPVNELLSRLVQAVETTYAARLER